MEINDPLELLSLKVLGVGAKASLIQNEPTADADQNPLRPNRVIRLEVSFGFGKWSKAWRV